MSKEELYPLIKKCFENSRHPNVKDDFETVWTIHEKFFPFKETYFTPKESLELIKSIRFDRNHRNKNQLIEELSKFSDDNILIFDTDYSEDYDDYYPVLNVYNKVKETNENIAYRLSNTLISWASMSGYGIEKKLYFLEKENQKLKDEIQSISKRDY